LNKALKLVNQIERSSLQNFKIKKNHLGNDTFFERKKKRRNVYKSKYRLGCYELYKIENKLNMCML